MKILFQSRIDLFNRRGGDTVQMEKTAEELEKLGVQVEIDNSPNKDLFEYDLVHLFNIDWPANVYLCAQNARNQGKPIVLSPIHHSFQEIERYESEYKFGLRRIVNFVFEKREQREKFKDFCRMIADPKKTSSTVTEFKKGILDEQRELLEMSAAILVQTEAEVGDIEEDFGVNSGAAEDKNQPPHSPTSPDPSGEVSPAAVRIMDAPVYKVVNGVDRRFAEATPDWFVEKYGWKDFTLCVGRIEPRKNQLSVIKAVNSLLEGQPHSPAPEAFPAADSLKLVFVGKISWRHPEYALRFKRLVKKHNWIKHIERISYENMGSAYAAAKVHVSASWFETTGLVSLEAGLAGCNVVATGERARDYLEDYAVYCDPGDIESIQEAIQKAYVAEFNPEFKNHILDNFTWDKTAEQTLDVYRTVLKDS